MINIEFYIKRNGKSPIKDWLTTLYQTDQKRYAKVAAYIDVLAQLGFSAGEPYIKYLRQEKIWELRPARDRILFFAAQKDSFVLLHAFMKKTQKTPKSELTKAIKEKNDFLSRRS